jgi:hypothetical protein
MNDVDHFYLQREDQLALVGWLRKMFVLSEELAITITRQDRVGGGDPRVSMGEREQPLPFNAHASEVADDLNATLVAWARHVCEHRGVAYNGKPGVLGLARWLDRNIIALALTPGSEEALDEISDAIRRAQRALDRPPVARVLLGVCPHCRSRVMADPGNDSADCRTCGAELTLDAVRKRIDGSMIGMILPAKEAAEVLSARYGVPIKAKTVYDMAYRKTDPISTVTLADGTVAFPLGPVVADLRRRGKVS